MRIEKKKAKKWSLQELEARPGITKTQIVEECIKNMYKNGWDFVEMASWFNQQLDSEGKLKYLNQIGEPLRGPNCGKIFKDSKKRKKKVQNPATTELEKHQDFIIEQIRSGKNAAEIHQGLLGRRSLEFTPGTTRRFVARLKEELQEKNSQSQVIVRRPSNTSAP